MASDPTPDVIATAYRLDARRLGDGQLGKDIRTLISHALSWTDGDIDMYSSFIAHQVGAELTTDHVPMVDGEYHHDYDQRIAALVALCSSVVHSYLNVAIPTVDTDVPYRDKPTKVEKL